MTSMLDKAIAFMTARDDMHTFTLDDLRRAAGIALRSQYRLAEQLSADPRVERHGGRTFSLRGCVVPD